jgi:reductive dehalogenase
MLIYPRSNPRPFHWGLFPLEALPRDATIIQREAARPASALSASSPHATPETDSSTGLNAALIRYQKLFADFAQAEPMPAVAPVPDDLEQRTQDIKGAAYFMDASQVGICRIPASVWLENTTLPAQNPTHNIAIVILLEYGRLPETNNLAHHWIKPAVHRAAALRADEIAACIAGHIRTMGFAAQAHTTHTAQLDAERLAVLAGLAVRDDLQKTIKNPFLDQRFALAIVSTDYQLACDLPLHREALNKAGGLRYWWGINGAQSGRERRRRAKRPSHASRYPMETVKRVDRPTTLILDDEVPRVPKRAAFFERALRGDLGAKAQQERGRFAFKHPLSFSQLGMIRAMVPLQDGPLADPDSAADAALDYSDPEANTRAVKALAYFLGADLAGICEIPNYAWFSHREDGEAIQPYHRYAVVMLIDQGYETMEGASGDDWISGAQSMRAYLRGAEIAGVMAELLRSLGFPARAQTNADSDVLHIPLLLWAGLGELSRIGELVLNPFVGPRFKSVVLTTDMPLTVDQPIDFGLQYFCDNCRKCARDCPCDAIPFGPKVMFNGYAMWKPDVERCTRYRLTNSKGSACGRCMKTCPLNKVVDADGAWLIRASSWLGVNAMWLKPALVPIAAWLDDKLGYGKRNPAKKWWFDHEIINGKTVAARGANQRDINPKRHIDPARHKIAYYPAAVMPAPDTPTPVKPDRKAALALASELETPEQAIKRADQGQTTPWHYRPTPLVGDALNQPLEAGPYRE